MIRNSPGSLVCGLIGSGVGASFTPLMHEREGRHWGLNYVYRAVDLDSVGGSDRLPLLIRGAADLGFRGLNITHPLKRRVIDLLDELSPDAERLEAVNTVVFDDGRAIGHNTDWSGFTRSFDRGMADVAIDRVVQIGAGGAGSAVAYAMLRRGCGEYVVIDADPERAESLCDSLRHMLPAAAVRAAGRDKATTELSRADGLINATPVGMLAHPGMAVASHDVRPDLWVADVVYRPSTTELLRCARRIGARTLSGSGMAVYQAVDAFRLFTGIEPDADRMFAHMAELVDNEEDSLSRVV